MRRAEIRLECLKLRNRLDQKAEDVIAAAKILEAYVLEGLEKDEATVKAPPETSKKKVGNPEIFR